MRLECTLSKHDVWIFKGQGSVPIIGVVWEQNITEQLK